MDNLLSIVTFLPLLAAAILAVFLRGNDEAARRNAKVLALVATIATFVISIAIYTQFDPNNTGFQLVEEYEWFGGLTYKLGVDGISVLFVLLTTFLMPIVIGACWLVEERVKEYMILFLILETLMIAVFCSLDLILFYVVFEAGLIPMFLIVGIWGGANRIYAAFKFFLYTLFGSVLMLVAMLAMWWDAGTTDIPTLLNHTFASDSFVIAGITIVGGMQTLLFLAFFASFAVKMPMWPVHTWLPDAHVSGPNGRFCRAGCNPVENGRLRLPAFFASYVPCCCGSLGDIRDDFVCDRYHLHIAGCDDARRHEEVDRLFFGRAHGLCDHGYLYVEPTGP